MLFLPGQILNALAKNIKQDLSGYQKGLLMHSLFCVICVILCIGLRFALNATKTYFLFGFMNSLGKKSVSSLLDD